MCGIAGIAGFEDQEGAGAQLDAMLQTLARRGPDSEGVESWPGVLLGHRRLAILDLSEAGRQPMLSPDRAIGVVFNGCIYNFLEIRAELERAGAVFRSHCDTEVLVRGYAEWGIDGLVARLRGMFAFAVWDQARGVLTLVRDRLGVKPLVYAERNGQIAFASSVAALRAAGWTGETDPNAVLEFLEFGYVTDERTIYEGVSKVPAATIVEWRSGRIVSTRRYWHLPEPDESLRISFDEAVEETERLFVEAVRLRLYSDVPIGALLSGGIDSTLVCWATARLNANITAFTVSTPGDPEDEGPETVETAKLLGIPHQIVELPRQAPHELLDTFTAAYGEPFACSSGLAMLRVAEAVRSRATVLLTGDGGDDVYLGYSFQRDYWWAQQAARRLPAPAAGLWRAAGPLVRRLPGMRRPAHFLDYVTGGLGAIARAHDGLPYYENRGMPGDRLAGLELAHRTLPLSLDSARNLMPRYLEYQQRMWFVAEFMTKVDGATMFHGLEARSPFLDQKLWEFAARLPVGLRLRGGRLKAVLRELVNRRVHPEIAMRAKRGFSIPVERWVLAQWSDAVDDLVSGSVLEREKWIRRGTLERAVREAKMAGTAPRQLWFLIVLERWLRAQASPVALRPAAATRGQS